MKNQNSKTIVFSVVMIALLSVTLISGCKKADADWASGIAGHYTNSANATDIVVNRIDDTHISITLTTGSGSGQYDVAFPSATVNSATAFTMNSVSQDGAVCIGTEVFSGTGTASGNNISLFMTVVGTGTGTPYDCSGTDTRNVSASK